MQKKIRQLFKGLFFVLLVIFLTNCKAFKPSTNGDLGIYNKNLPPEYHCTLMFSNDLNVQTFDGKEVWWGVARQPQGDFTIQIPSGNHTLLVYWSGAGDDKYHFRYAHVTKQYNFEAGKKYLMYPKLNGYYNNTKNTIYGSSQSYDQYVDIIIEEVDENGSISKQELSGSQKALGNSKLDSIKVNNDRNPISETNNNDIKTAENNTVRAKEDLMVHPNLLEGTYISKNGVNKKQITFTANSFQLTYSSSISHSIFEGTYSYDRETITLNIDSYKFGKMHRKYNKNNIAVLTYNLYDNNVLDINSCSGTILSGGMSMKGVYSRSPSE